VQAQAGRQQQAVKAAAGGAAAELQRKNVRQQQAQVLGTDGIGRRKDHA